MFLISDNMRQHHGSRRVELEQLDFSSNEAFWIRDETLSKVQLPKLKLNTFYFKMAWMVENLQKHLS